MIKRLKFKIFLMKNVHRNGEKGIFKIYTSHPRILFYNFKDIFKGFHFKVFIFNKFILIFQIQGGFKCAILLLLCQNSRNKVILSILAFGKESLLKKVINFQIYDGFCLYIMRNFWDINKLRFIFKGNFKTTLYNS